MKIIYNMIKYLALCAFLVILPNLAVDLHELYILDFKGQSVVMITSDARRGGGTGFQVKAPSGNKYILTNKHICQIKGNLSATTQDGRIVKLKRLEEDYVHDLCLLTHVPKLPALRVAKNALRHERAFLVGHPALRQLTLETGRIIGDTHIKLWGKCSAEYNQIPEDEDFGSLIMRFMGYCTKYVHSTHINNIAYGDNSGSPVMDGLGNVIGVLFAGNPSQPTASYMVPLTYVQDFLKDK